MPEERKINPADQVLNDPSSFLFASLADFYRQNMLFPEAIAMCRSGLEAQPDNIDGRLVLARCYLATAEPARAREELVKVLARQGEHGDAKKLLAEIDRSTPAAPPAPAAAPAPGQQPAPMAPAATAVPPARPTAPIPRPLDTVLPPAPVEQAPAGPVAAEPAPPAAATAEAGDNTPGYQRILADLQQTPQVLACLLVDDSGFVVAESYAGAVGGASDSESSAALATSIFRTAAEAMRKVKLGALERVIIETATEKVFLRRAGPLLLLLSAETSVKMGLVAVNGKRAAERVAALARPS
ncbi:MAG: roadblock/LC7 domain-containing protein [Candidatus Edwardsbacteria bacterium]|jgi:predicted regulator of Ras-like GTPase activity (Roadblock/LC7/MglB family)|nr:roadblock/LC7 domain-containing protein [Candidatus Edwardsbacteria bacterium]